LRDGVASKEGWINKSTSILIRGLATGFIELTGGFDEGSQYSNGRLSLALFRFFQNLQALFHKVLAQAIGYAV